MPINKYNWTRTGYKSDTNRAQTKHKKILNGYLIQNNAVDGRQGEKLFIIKPPEI